MENELLKEKMEVVKAIAQANIELSRAKETFSKLKEEEKEYLKDREKLVLERIDAAVAGSKHLLDEIHENHEKVKDFYKSVMLCSDFLDEAYEKFSELVVNFNEKSERAEKVITEKEENLSLLKKDIDIQRSRIESDMEIIKKKEKFIKDEKALIESRQKQIKAALQVLNHKNGGKA